MGQGRSVETTAADQMAELAPNRLSSPATAGRTADAAGLKNTVKLDMANAEAYTTHR